MASRLIRDILRSGKSSICLLAYIVLVGTFPGSPTAHAQTNSGLSTGIERDISRYSWLTSLRVDDTFGAWNVRADNQFISDAFILFGDRLSIRDENRFRLQADGAVGPRYRLTIGSTLGWFSLSRVFNANMRLGLRYAAGQHLWIEPRLGASLDRRPGAQIGTTPAALRSDVGPLYGAAMQYARGGLSAWRIDATGAATWRLITPRRANDLLLTATASRNVNESHLSTTVYVSSARRDAYQAVSFLNRSEGTLRSESVEATRSDTLRLSGRMTAPVGSGFKLTGALGLGANRRTVRTFRAPDESLFFDTDFTRRVLDVEADLAYKARRFEASAGVKGGVANEERNLANREDLTAAQAAQKTDLLRQADFDKGFMEFHAHSTFSPLRFLTLHVDGAASILRHDTPDINPDDRDEQFLTGRMGARVHFSKHLAAELSLFTSQYKTVYLKSARSAENNVQRAIRFRPAIVWTPSSRTRLRITSEVRATYTIDDFVLPGRAPRDQSARELRYEVEADQALAASLRTTARLTYSDLRLGRFVEEVFAEIPFDTLQTVSGWLQIHSDGALKTSVGVRLFIRSDYNRSTTVRYVVGGGDGAPITSSITRPGRETIAQIGPTATISWPLRGRTELVFDGWLVVQKITQSLYGDLPDSQRETIRRAARTGSRTIIPNLSMRVVWNF